MALGRRTNVSDKLNLISNRMRSHCLRGWLQIAPLLLIACSDASSESVRGYTVRYWPGVTREQALSTVEALEQFTPLSPKSRVAVWREPQCVCVRVMDWNGRTYRMEPAKPGSAAWLSSRIFNGEPTCVGFEGDSGVAWPLECSDPRLAEFCGHSLTGRAVPS